MPITETRAVPATGTPDAPGESAPRDAALRTELRAALDATRARTLRLLGPVSPDDARAQHDPLMSPLVWDLGHIAAFESLWLERNVAGPIAFAEMPGTYNPFEHPRATRGALALPSLGDALGELAQVRDRVLRGLDAMRVPDASPLLHDGYVYRMVAQHEDQHQETMLQTLQLTRGAPYRAPRSATLPEPPAEISDGAMVRFPGGTVTIGTDDRAAAYDNERPRHAVTLTPFDIDITPVTNGAYLRFVEAGGYDEPRWWSPEGWRWRTESGARAPRHWERAAGEWHTRVMDRERPIDARRPVCHVCWHEAAAYARFAGKRLPTEVEWEAAATWDPAAGRARAWPWGDAPPGAREANLEQRAFDTAPVGAYPAGASPIGCLAMVGDVWEWTASDFGPYPGFAAFPYREYSEVFFGAEYRVLRGGSWATSALVARPTFRNWDYPIRRQIFAGFRCARDA